MSKELTLGSLFDGSGGFPLGAKLLGIKPIWASEIEPFPIRVTTKRMPEVKHLGNVSDIKGYEIEPVDIITFGSPCQDMSIAGKRAGLNGSRSNLFFEAIRIIKEMREKTNGTKPRYIVWENVPGAFSSNKGEDFKKVLKSVKSKDIKLMHLDLTSGKMQDLSWQMISASHGGYLMLSTGESPKEEDESILSAILMEKVPEKYYLSPKACLGILKRANARGKELPKILRLALETVAKICA